MTLDSSPILLAIDHFGSGGAQRQIVAIANELVSSGHAVHIIIYFPQHDHYRKNLDPRVIVHEIPKTNRIGINVVFGVLKLLYRFHYKSAIAFLHTPAIYLEIAALFYFKDLKIYYSERSAFELENKGILSWLKKLLHRSCHHITSNSMSQTEVLIQEYGMDKVSFIPNIMPDNLFSINSHNHKNTNKEIVVLAHTRPFKNFTYVSEALIEYKKIYNAKPPTIHWYGEVYQSAEMDLLQRILEANDLESSLIFHGVVEDVIPVLKNAYFLLHPSKYESSSNSVAEALSTATPVLLGNIGDHQAIIDRSSSGYILDLANPADLAECLFHIDQLSTDKYSQLCKNAYDFASNSYRRTIVGAQYERLLS